MTQDEIGDTRQRRRLSEQERWCNLAGALILSEAREMNGYDEENEAIDISIDMLSLCFGIEREVLIKFIQDGISYKQDFSFEDISRIIGKTRRHTRVLWKIYIGPYSHKKNNNKKYVFSQREVRDFLNKYFFENKTIRGGFSLQELRKRAIMSIGGERD